MYLAFALHIHIFLSVNRVLHNLQIATQMQKRLSEGTTSNILRKPANLLSFIFHVFESASLVLERGPISGTKPYQEAPRTEDDVDGADSDDEAAGSEAIGPDDELIETAITLLLSILEGTPNLLTLRCPC